ncbi:MAG: winged helix-turn-helix transcriptional regulator [Bacteroidales bacterium]|nr:winged helix-turn-helix transcriptional regulator [Bacteroidales bacterium]
MVGYGENLGSGFPTIISAWKDAKWGEPELKNIFEIEEVELVLPIPVGGANDRVTDTINDTINDKINDGVMATYTIIKLNPGIKRKDISTISGKSLPTIARHIDVLAKEGLIEYRGSRKTGGY